MTIKNYLVMAGLFSSAFFSHVIFADTAVRCMALMDQRTQGSVLQLSNCNLLPEQAQTILTYLNSHPGITELQINNNPKFGSAGIKIIMQNTSLQTLSITGCNVDADGYAAIAKNTTLKHLIRQDFDKHTFNGAAALSTSTSLTSINFENAMLPGTTLVAFSKIQSLEEINLASFYLSAEDEVTAFNTMPNLTKLNLAGSYIFDESFSVLANNPRFQELGFGEENVGAGPKILNAIANNPSLSDVTMVITSNSYKDFVVLKNNLKLTALSVEGPLNDTIVNIIASMKNLTELTLIMSNYDVNDLTALAQQLPKLKKLKIKSRCWPIDDDTAAAIAANSSITDLSVDFLTESAALALAKNTHLQHLTINNIRKLPEDPNVDLLLSKSIGELAKIPSLITLNYTGDFKLDKATAAAITSNPNFKTLHLNRDVNTAQIASAALQQLAAGNNLEDLSLSSDDIDDNAAIALANNSAIKQLSLETITMTDNSVISLAKNTTLTSLTINMHNLSSSAYTELMTNRSITYIDAYTGFNPQKKSIRK